MLDLSEIKKFGNIELLARQMVEGFITGLHKSPYHGFSVEFAEHRQYNTGESTRHLDWKIYARTDKLFVKRYEEETNLRARILLDVSSSMYYPKETQGKLTFSLMAAAALAYMFQKQRDAVGLTTFSDKLEQETDIKSSQKHLHQIFVELQRLLDSTPPTQKQTAAAETIHQIATRLHRRSLVIIFSDMLDNRAGADELFAALQHLKHNRHEVLLFHVQDTATERSLSFDDRPYRFVDLETGESVKLRPNDVREDYLQKANDEFYELKLRCGKYKIDFIEVDIKNSLEQVLIPYLIKRTRMR